MYNLYRKLESGAHSKETLQGKNWSGGRSQVGKIPTVFVVNSVASTVSLTPIQPPAAEHKLVHRLNAKASG